MKQSYDGVQPLKLVKRSLFLIILTLALGTIGTAFAQSTSDVCRETQRMFEQYEREWKELLNLKWVKGEDDEVRSLLSELRRAIANGFVVSKLDRTAYRLGLDKPGASTKERLAFQKNVRDVLERMIQKANNISREDLNLQEERAYAQMSRRSERLIDLHCADVLAREQSSSAATELSVIGTWKWAWAETGDPQEHGTVTFTSDKMDTTKGTMDWSGGSKGSWTQSGVTVELHWDKKITDTMTVIEGGKKLTGTNTKGWTVVGTRQ